MGKMLNKKQQQQQRNKTNPFTMKKTVVHIQLGEYRKEIRKINFSHFTE